MGQHTKKSRRPEMLGDHELSPPWTLKLVRRQSRAVRSAANRELFDILRAAEALKERARQFAERHDYGCPCALCRWMEQEQPRRLGDEKLHLLENLMAFAWAAENSTGFIASMLVPPPDVPGG